MLQSYCDIFKNPRIWNYANNGIVNKLNSYDTGRPIFECFSSLLQAHTVAVKLLALIPAFKAALDKQKFRPIILVSVWRPQQLVALSFVSGP